MLGWIMLVPLGVFVAAISLLLVVCIVAYDAFHKQMKFAPLLMAACRFLLYFLAAATTQKPIATKTLWRAGALATYVAGVSYLARGESAPGKIIRWPLVLLAAPVVANVMLNSTDSGAGWIAAGGLLVWIGYCVRGMAESTAKTVAGLLAGIVVVDWSAVAPPLAGYGIAFPLLLLLVLLLQRTIPAT
jgi:4-hydroxybenzoate polyprenyltransferase